MRGARRDLCREHDWNMPRNRRVSFAIWVTLWAIIVLTALALIITVVAWFTIP